MIREPGISRNGPSAQRVLFRADGNGAIGFGHVFRMLALAEMLKDMFECIFVINRPDSFIHEQIRNVCSEIVVLDNDYRYILPDHMASADPYAYDLHGIVSKGDIVVLDGYHFGSEYQHRLHESGCYQIFIDDLLEHYPFADAIINHAPGLDPGQYRTNARLCLGLDYAILRKPFFLPFSLRHPEKKSIFICLGGADPHGFTYRFCQAILSANVYDRVHVLCSDQFESDMLASIQRLENKYPVTSYRNLSAQQLVKVMDECTHALVSSSTVLIESYSRGLICYTGYQADNQRLIYDGFIRQGLAIGLGDFHALTDGELKENMLSARIETRVLEGPLHSKENFIGLFSKYRA